VPEFIVPEYSVSECSVPGLSVPECSVPECSVPLAPTYASVFVVGFLLGNEALHAQLVGWIVQPDSHCGTCARFWVGLSTCTALVGAKHVHGSGWSEARARLWLGQSTCTALVGSKHVHGSGWG
jgi:hypothetical protein